MAEKKTNAKATAADKQSAKAKAKPTATAKTARTNTAAKQTSATKKAAPPATAAKTTAKPAVTATTAAKTKKQPAKKKTADKSAGARAAAFVKDNKIRVIIISAVAFILVLALILGIALGTRSCKKSVYDGNLSDVDIPVPEKGNYIPGSTVKPNSAYDDVSAGTEHYFTEPDTSYTEYDTSYKTNTAVGYFGQVIGKVDRNVPERTRDEGLAVYPQYGYTLTTVIGNGDEQKAARNALIYESSYLTATGTWNGGAGNYTWMDKDGYLYSGTTAEPVQTLDKSGRHRRLYKHSASVGLYGGDVSANEEGIIKTVTMRPRGYNGYGVTGVYAPAGEVIKIQLSEKDMNATGGITIHIGQALYNGKANNIWTDKNQMPRMPVLLNTMTVNKDTSTYDGQTKTYTAYVGSYLGGPLYIRNSDAEFTATVSGGVAYPHFILGYTTEEEFNENSKSSAPYFDLEVWNYGVLHSGPKRQAAGLTYQDLYKAAVLWDKIASVTTTNSLQGIVFLYDPFVAAGAAVAFPGQRSVNCPESWMRSSLSYDGIVTSGSWGNLHEYHHNFQGYGVGNGGEVTNNGMTLVSYALFTKISASRGISDYGAQSLSGWNKYTSATWTLNDTLKISKGQEPDNGKQGLALYATLLHNFGPDAYIQAKVRQQRQGYGESYEGYLKAWQDVTHNDLTYFFKDVLQGIDADKASSLKNPNYSKFVPVSSVYQTGRSYLCDGQKKYITTMQPYLIPYGEQFTVDLRKYTAEGGQYSYGSVVIPDGFTYTIKNIVQPENGTFTASGTEGVFIYTPDGNSTRSGQIKVTLGITKDDGAFTVDDVDLILELEQSHETNKLSLQRTTYTYSANNMYADAQTAYESGFAGYTAVQNKNHTNPTQNCNTDIWFYPDTPEARAKYPNAPEEHFVHDNTIEVIEGKLLVVNEGKYRIYLRGRLNCALYYSLDGGKTYKLGATIKDKTAPNKSYLFRPDDENTYFDLELEADSWVYFKEVLIVQSSPAVSYIGLGMSQWTAPMFTMVDKYYDKNGNEVDSENAEGYDHTVTHYYDYQGNEVSEEEANSSDVMPPVVTENQQPYVNAYRSSYEFPETTDFTTDYFYKRTYSYSYTGDPVTVTDGLTQTYVAEQSNYTAWDGDPSYSVGNIFDGNPETVIHTGRDFFVSADNPAVFTVDLGKEITANTLTLYTSHANANHEKAFPKNFTLQGSLDGETFFDMGSWTGKSAPAVSADFALSGAFTFRYYKLCVTATNSNTARVAFADIALKNILRLTGNHICPDNGMFAYSGDWHGKQLYSVFGHVYAGAQNATMSFEFEGARVGFISPSAYGKNFEVYIDGKKADSIALKTENGSYSMTYLCDALSEGKHRVEFRCTGEAYIDSVVIFP